MQPQPQPDPLDQIKKAKAMLSEINGGQTNGSNDAMLAMMLTLAQPRPTGPDPSVVQILERLATKIEKLEQSGMGLAALPPPPPPPPSLDIPAITNLLATVAVPLIVKMMDRGNDRNQLSPRDLIEILDKRRSNESEFGAREAINLMRDLHSSVPQQSIVDKMQELAALRELALGIANGGGGNSGPAQTTFWDAVAAFANSKPIGEAIGKVFGSEVERRRQRGPEVNALPRQQMHHLPPPPQRPWPTQPPEAMQPPPRPQPVQTAPAPAAPAPAQAVPAPAPTAPQPEPVQAAPAPVEQPVSEMERAAEEAKQYGPPAPRIVLPDSFAEYARKVNEADNDEVLVISVIEALNDLRPHEQWQSFVLALLNGVAKNDKSVLVGLTNWSRLLVHNGVFAHGSDDKITQAFTTHWDAVHSTIAGMLGMQPQDDDDDDGAPYPG